MPEARPITILYMEDDLGLARLFQKKLKRAGYLVDIAHDGAEGLARYEAGSYDLVAVDQRMPVHDGLEVIRILSARGPLPPTIMITGTGNERIAIEAMKLGAGDYIVKDVELGYLELLPSVIEQVLNQRRLVEEKQKALAALQQLNSNLALLNLAGQKLAASLDLQEIMELLLQAVSETIGAEGSSVWLRDERPDCGLVCQAAFRHDQLRSPADLRLSAGHSIVGWVVQEGRGVIISDVQSDPRFTPEIDEKIDFVTRSALAVPLRARDTVIGALEVVNKLDDHFDDDDLTVVETLAASAAIAIDNARLVEALRRQAAELTARNEELDAFAHTVAHDLKTPLGPILGLAELLEKHHTRLSDDHIEESLQGLRRNGRKMSNIIDELLLLAKMHDTDIQLAPLDMAGIVAESQQRLSYMIEEHRAIFTLPDEWPAALGYGPWAEEVWVNYLSNGLKYGGRPPQLVLGGEDQSDGMVRFWVRDNGPGLTSEEQAQLFVPFTQLSHVRAEGHGLGLSIVRRIVERLGGTVAVERASLPDQGSVFSFTLPRIPQDGLPPYANS